MAEQYHTGLTKENFFNRIMDQYPLALNQFLLWVDKFKEDNNWDNIFKRILDAELSSNKLREPKFHEIPFFIQDGILVSFFLSKGINITAVRHPADFNQVVVAVDDMVNKQMIMPMEETASDLMSNKVAAIALAFKILNDSLTTYNN